MKEAIGAQGNGADMCMDDGEVGKENYKAELMACSLRVLPSCFELPVMLLELFSVA